jgi:hypothetical protein
VNLGSAGILSFTVADPVRLIFLAVASGLVSGCMPGAGLELRPNPMADPAAQAVVGCWRLEPVGWRHDVFLPGPTLVHLDPTLADSPGNDRVLELRSLNYEPDTLRRFRLAGWGVHERDDRIHVWYGNGFAGLRFEFILVNGSLQGKARTFTDTWPQFSRGGMVRGVAIACPGVSMRPAPPNQAVAADTGR